MGKVQLLLNHWLYPFIIHTKQQQFIEVQFRLENTYVQLRVWLQSKNKNDWILLRERRKYYEINIYWMSGLLMKQKMVGWNFDETQTYRMDCFNTQNVGHTLEGLNFQYLNFMGPGPKNKRGPRKI